MRDWHVKSSSVRVGEYYIWNGRGCVTEDGLVMSKYGELDTNTRKRDSYYWKTKSEAENFLQEYLMKSEVQAQIEAAEKELEAAKKELETLEAKPKPRHGDLFRYLDKKPCYILLRSKYLTRGCQWLVAWDEDETNYFDEAVQKFYKEGTWTPVGNIFEGGTLNG